MNEVANSHFDADVLDEIAERLMAVVADIQRLRGSINGSVPVPRWLTVDQVVEMTPFGKSKVWELISTGELRSHKRGGRRVIEASDVEAFMAGEGGSATQPSPSEALPKRDRRPKASKKLPAARPVAAVELVADPVGRDLTPAELVWLQRLPLDPTKVSEKDGEALAWLAVELKPGSGDARLVESILEPVRAFYIGQPRRRKAT